MRFVLDMTPFNDDATIISIGLLVHSRRLSVAWCVMPSQEQWTTGQWEIVSLLRVCKEHTCRRQFGRRKRWTGWCRFEHFIQKKGQQWYGWAQVWQDDSVQT